MDEHLGAHADLGLGLDLADAGEGLADRAEQAGVTAAPPAGCVGRSSAEGHAARCTEPSCHHDQTSSVT